jgi:hypothetical protein
MIKTRSQFYYGIEIDETNRYVDFKEGAGPIIYATLAIGQYSHEEFTTELGKRFNEAGAGNYTWSIARTDRILSVVSDVQFNLPTQTGPHALSGIWEIMGMQGPDKTGGFGYTGSYSSGKSFRPQFKLQGYVSTDQNNGPVESSLNVSGSGRRELVRFGTEKLMECWIPYITDLYQAAGSPIEYNTSAFAEAKSFMEYLIKGGHIEFMPDRTLPNAFETLQLKSTTESQDGISYRLEEMQDQGLQNYFRINKLTFRKIEP